MVDVRRVALIATCDRFVRLGSGGALLTDQLRVGAVGVVDPRPFAEGPDEVGDALRTRRFLVFHLYKPPLASILRPNYEFVNKMK